MRRRGDLPRLPRQLYSCVCVKVNRQCRNCAYACRYPPHALPYNDNEKGADAVVFEQEELAALKSIFDEVTAEPWFNVADRDRFAQYLIHTYPEGEFDAAVQRAVIMEAAKRFYSRDTAA